MPSLRAFNAVSSTYLFQVNRKAAKLIIAAKEVVYYSQVEYEMLNLAPLSLLRPALVPGDAASALPPSDSRW